MANLGRLAVAILGVLAYQNRDKIGELLRGDRDPNNPHGRLLDQLSKGVSGTALGDIVDRFRNAGAGSKVDSWVSPGPNQPIEPKEVETAIDDETLASLSMQTGLSRDELIARITRDLPEAINKLTPNGEMPAASAEDITLLDRVPPRTGD
ncbi:YidB family protein [Mesorhizobium sp.]|uniref:YidB family protein n=1 Tax=Mesorhizobium sp. TaxID=1871066 RepID=UPI000FE7B25B|nr:YidB family protein [Mesorhizobium sp.]RWE79624.1 MAG: DUF937 domain-containing protein [Mesorhizobium sp.]